LMIGRMFSVCILSVPVVMNSPILVVVDGLNDKSSED